MRKTFCVLVCDVRVLLCFSSSSRFVCVLWLKNPFSKRRGGKTGFFLALSFFFRERERDPEREEIGDWRSFFFCLQILLESFHLFIVHSLLKKSIRALFFFGFEHPPTRDTQGNRKANNKKRRRSSRALFICRVRRLLLL